MHPHILPHARCLIHVHKHAQHSYKRNKFTFLSMTDTYAYSENATRITLHCTNVLGYNYVTNILKEKGKVFSSLAGSVERSRSITAPDIRFTASLSHQITHYTQMTLPAARDVVYTHCHACWKVGKIAVFMACMLLGLCAHVLNYAYHKHQYYCEISLRCILVCNSI